MLTALKNTVPQLYFAPNSPRTDFFSSSKTSLLMHQCSGVGHGQLWRAWNSTPRLPSRRLFLYVICGCAYLMVHPVVAANVTEAGGNSTKASTNGTDLGEDVEQIWGWRENRLGPCADYYDHLLEHSTEYNKAASRAASIIMALFPALLAFAPLPTARIGLLSALSNSHGFFAAVFTFGLPVEQLDAIYSVTNVKKLLGNTPPTAPPATNPPVLQPVNDSNPTIDPPATTNLNTQGAIELVPLGGSPTPSSNPCEGIPTQQCVNPSASNDTVENAPALIRQEVLNFQHSKRISVQLILAIYSCLHLFGVQSIIGILTDPEFGNVIWFCPGPGPHTIVWLVGVICIVGSLRQRYESRAFAATEAIHISKASRMETGITEYWNTLWDPHPIVLILRPSPSATSDLDLDNTKKLFIRRFYQLCWLFLLSFFFSGTVGRSLFSTLSTVWLLVFFVAGSRLISTLTLTRYTRLHVIEYDNLEELRMLRRCIGAFTNARVEVREAFISWFDFSGIKWRECIESYHQGQHVVHGATHTVCAIHAHKLGRHWLVKEAIPMVCALLVVFLVSIVPRMVGKPSVFWSLAPPVFVTGIVSIMKRERWIVLCNCRIDNAQSA